MHDRKKKKSHPQQNNTEHTSIFGDLDKTGKQGHIIKVPPLFRTLQSK